MAAVRVQAVAQRVDAEGEPRHAARRRAVAQPVEEGLRCGGGEAAGPGGAEDDEGGAGGGGGEEGGGVEGGEVVHGRGEALFARVFVEVLGEALGVARLGGEEDEHAPRVGGRLRGGGGRRGEQAGLFEREVLLLGEAESWSGGLGLGLFLRGIVGLACA
jgi:hypothetical protein